MRLLPNLDLARPSRRHWLGYMLLAPAVILMVTFVAYPLFVSFDISFQNVNIVRFDQPRRPFTTANYERLFYSPEFWNAVYVTFKLVVVVTLSCFALGLGTALLVNNSFKGRPIARLLVALPWAIPEVIAVVIFAWLFDSSFGLINWLLIQLNLIGVPVNWFSTPGAAFAAVAVVMVWKGYPFVSIMALAGLQSIPEDYYNAAKVDGASAWQRFVHITIPSLMPILGVSMILTMLWVFRDFSIIYTLTGGGPLGSTETLAIMTYEQAFGFFRMGYASAVGIITLIICVVVSRLLLRRPPEAL